MSLLKPTRVILLIAFAFVLGAFAHYVAGMKAPSVKPTFYEIVVDQAIMDDNANDIIEKLEEAKDDEMVKAVILRINSPGGSVAPSQEIYEMVKEVADTKPVISSFGSSATSGAYYIALPSTLIISNPGSITGSIGVLLPLKSIKSALDKIGVVDQTIASGSHKNAGDPLSELTEEQRIHLQSLTDDTYNQFVEALAESRGFTFEEASKLAEGKIYSGRQALDLRLVDGLGTRRTAINKAAELVGVEVDDVDIKTKNPGKKTPFEELLGVASNINKLVGIALTNSLQ